MPSVGDAAATPELPDLTALAALGSFPDGGRDPLPGPDLPDLATLLRPASAGRVDLPDLGALRSPDPGLPDLSALTTAGVGMPDLDVPPDPSPQGPSDPVMPDLSGLVSLPFGEAPPATDWDAVVRAPVQELAQLGRTDVVAPGSEWISFTIGDTRFVVPLASVAQVGDVAHVSRVPNTPSWIVGVIGWREDVISLIDVPALIGTAAESRGRQVVVVRAADDDMAAGLLVERIGRIERHPDEEFRERDFDGALGRIADGAFAGEFGDVVILDVDRLLDEAWPTADDRVGIGGAAR
ncbi:MAG: hypothetical protein E6I94_03000 [Chloroflexi bacterium]|nr:MAG: hypothetical protein E6I94_03000 [Chloroflexota bacterium]